MNSGPGRNSNSRALLVVDERAGQVGRQQVGRELRAREPQPERLGEATGRRGSCRDPAGPRSGRARPRGCRPAPSSSASRLPTTARSTWSRTAAATADASAGRTASGGVRGWWSQGLDPGEEYVDLADVQARVGGGCRDEGGQLGTRAARPRGPGRPGRLTPCRATSRWSTSSTSRRCRPSSTSRPSRCCPTTRGAAGRARLSSPGSRTGSCVDVAPAAGSRRPDAGVEVEPQGGRERRDGQGRSATGPGGCPGPRRTPTTADPQRERRRDPRGPLAACLARAHRRAPRDSRSRVQVLEGGPGLARGRPRRPGARRTGPRGTARPAGSTGRGSRSSSCRARTTYSEDVSERPGRHACVGQDLLQTEPAGHDRVARGALVDRREPGRPVARAAPRRPARGGPRSRPPRAPRAHATGGPTASAAARFRATRTPSRAATAIRSPTQARSASGFTPLVTSRSVEAGVKPSVGEVSGLGGSKT